MIDELPSNNPPPQIIGETPTEKAVFDAQYDWTDQDRVIKAIDFIADHPDDAWLGLLARYNDDRYCITWKWNGSATNVLVSGICQRVIEGALIAGYYECLPASLQHAKAGWSVRAPGDIDGDDLLAWCKKRRGTPLYELQIEMCEWAAKKLENESRDDGQAAIAAIMVKIASLRRERRAMLPIRLDHRSRRVTFYP